MFRGSGLQKLLFQLGAVGNSCFAVDISEMKFESVPGDEERRTDGVVLVSLEEQKDDLRLLPGKIIGQDTHAVGHLLLHFVLLSRGSHFLSGGVHFPFPQPSG